MFYVFVIFYLSTPHIYTYTHKQTQILHNYIQIINPKYIISYPEVQHPHGLVTTILGLKLRINSQYFEDGAMRIKCVASISPVLWTNDKEKVLQQQLQQFHNEQIPQPSIDTREVVFLGKHLMFIGLPSIFIIFIHIFTFVFMSFFITIVYFDVKIVLYLCKRATQYHIQFTL